MFFEIDRNQNSSIVLDIKTKKIFEISTYLRKKRTDIHEKEFLHIGLMQNGTNYSLFVDNFSMNVYTGTFLNMFDNIILFNHNIRVKNVLYVHGGILIQVRCNCWGKFEIEIPMYMEQTIFLDTTKGVLNKGTLVALTYTPFMIYNNKD